MIFGVVVSHNRLKHFSQSNNNKTIITRSLLGFHLDPDHGNVEKPVNQKKEKQKALQSLIRMDGVPSVGIVLSLYVPLQVLQQNQNLAPLASKHKAERFRIVLHR